MCPELMQAVERWEGIQKDWNLGERVGKTECAMGLSCYKGRCPSSLGYPRDCEQARLLSAPSSTAMCTGSITSELQLVSQG